MAQSAEKAPYDESSQSATVAESSTDNGNSNENSPEVRSAARAVARAEAELRKARELYESVRDEAVEKVKKARETTLGDVLDGTLETVKRHPGPGLLVAAAVGVFLGRLFRK